MDLLALIMALTVTPEQAQEVLRDYIQEHPEAVIDVDVGTTEEILEYLGIEPESEAEEEQQDEEEE